MRSLLLVSLAVIAACSPQTVARPPPTDRFYYPSSVVHAPSSHGPEGILYVASFNTDKLYDEGSLIAVDLDRVKQPSGDAGLPPLGFVSPTGPVEITDLQISDAGEVLIESFAGEMAGYPLDAGLRLFVPSRAEGDLLQIVDARDDALTCYAGTGDKNCIPTSPSLTALSPPGDAGISDPSSQPRAPQPFGVSISSAGQLFVSHMAPADDPVNSNLNQESYLVQFDARAPVPVAHPSIDSSYFHSLAIYNTNLDAFNGYLNGFSGPSNSVAAGARFVYVSGRYNAPNAELLRIYDTYTGAASDIGIEANFQALEARGLALNDTESLLYMATRTPDGLLVMSIENPLDLSGNLRIHEVSSLPLPAGADELQIISRRALGLGDLVAITCTGANTMVIYDQDLGQLVADVPSVGLQPFGLAVDNRGTSARLYIAAWGESRIAVVDIPDLTQPSQATVVARLGAEQTCLINPNAPFCPGVPGQQTSFP